MKTIVILTTVICALHIKAPGQVLSQADEDFLKEQLRTFVKRYTTCHPLTGLPGWLSQAM